MSIDRAVLLARHNPHLTGIDSRSPLQIGNGQFAMAVDVTGLQTFPEAYPGPGGGTLLDTQSQWGWHSMPYGRDFCVDDCLKEYESPRGPITYMDMGRQLWGASADGTGAGGLSGAEGSVEEVYFRANPHRMSLGRISLILPDGTNASDLASVDQHLDLATGLLTSHFDVGRRAYDVTTVVDMDSDTVAAHVEVRGGVAGVRMSFPYASENPGNSQDWEHPNAHATRLICVEAIAIPGQPGRDGYRGIIERIVDDMAYQVEILTSGLITQVGPHEIEFRAEGGHGQALDVAVCFQSDSQWNLHASRQAVWVDEAINNATRGWREYWTTGAVSLSASDHPQALELERRVVLSRYVTRVNSAGLLPVAETGLYVNSWRGKFHLEMQWWHLAHFASWGNPEIVEQVLAWYDATLDSARVIAKRQGYPGARWLKSSGPEARETPSSIGSFLVWQQPHAIELAELVHRARPSREVLERWWPVVHATAQFMAAYPIDSTAGLVFPSPLIPSQECYAPMKESLTDPTLELVSWVYGLYTAAKWAQRLGYSELAEQWGAVALKVKKPEPLTLGAIRVYPAIGVPPWTTREDHPSMVAALGVTPDVGRIDVPTMESTLLDVRQDWEWASTWGWDYPMMAMTATRVGRPDLAVDSLLSEKGKNTYLPNGHNWQTPELPAYLPGNGGLLSAIALMTAGWDGSKPHPGFGPEWVVEWEGIVRQP